ncbi:hypothetical protein Leryth_017108 [Lithospermum erythrorhizon]|uniref:DNA-binding transcription factor n=1 Tax=Lithospermum erythrorhizon TaxID=34254 RepID=A0AAV3RIX9_LITER|nr:hypothetical protein Leryth_017108 [Lithospermum erythrorhizon]
MVVKDQEEVRKGPWTEEEDVQLAFYVNLFGDRRWDFIAKVSGLKRTGKSCRLRWVNYLHPGLKRGKLTPNEERLVIEYHAKWGNRWSKIAGKLPGRTDNEIKNFWRTHLRKNNSQEKKKTTIPPSISSTSISSVSSSSSNFNNSHHVHSMQGHRIDISDDSTSRNNSTSFSHYHKEDKGGSSRQVCSMDEIWNDIALPEVDAIIPPPVCGGFSQDATIMPPSIWEDNYYCPNNSILWTVDGGLL